jgi:tungstate transport system substrate-binding protein
MRFLSLLLIGVLSAGSACAQTQQSRDVILATTTSTRDSGLLDSLVPRFEQQSSYRVKVIAVGTGQAIANARRGDADVVLVHAPELERAMVDSGYFVNRRLVMHNEFLIVGPASDPAHIRGLTDAAAAFRRIAEQRGSFVSRADNSGTEIRERALWQAVSLTQPHGQPWYIESGQGMGATLMLASEKNAYTLTDIATFLSWRGKVDLEALVQGDPVLYNVYHVMELSPRAGTRVNYAGGKAFADFLVAPETQRLIGDFGRAQFGRSLFVPDAGKPDRW